MRCLQEVVSEVGEPIGQLTPFGSGCFGPIGFCSEPLRFPVSGMHAAVSGTVDSVDGAWPTVDLSVELL